MKQHFKRLKRRLFKPFILKFLFFYIKIPKTTFECIRAQKNGIYDQILNAYLSKFRLLVQIRFLFVLKFSEYKF